MTLWIITTCGGKKLAVPAPCEKMYRGSFAQIQMKAARAIPRARHLILSSKYGYMTPGTVIEPYDSRWGHPNTPRDEVLLAQIHALGIAPGDKVVHLGARVYATPSERVMPEGVEIYWLPGMLAKTGMGYQGSLYSLMTRIRSLPTGWERTRLR